MNPMVLKIDTLHSLKDDMVAFIEGHGMFRFKGYVDENVPTVSWDDEDNPESWKDFVEAAKAAGALFLTMSDAALEQDDLDLLAEQIEDQDYPDAESQDLEEISDYEKHIGKTGYVQLGFAHQGVVFLHETTTAWYERFQQLAERVEALSDIVIEDGPEE
jgi:hypothetical protein